MIVKIRVPHQETTQTAGENSSATAGTYSSSELRVNRG
jgi:hypothetical protein